MKGSVKFLSSSTGETFTPDDRFVDTDSSAEYKGQSSLIESAVRYTRSPYDRYRGAKNLIADLQCS